MIENSIEIQTNSSNVTELGELFFTEGKHENIKIMEDCGLPIPETCILGCGFDERKYQEWIDQHRECDLIIRTSRRPVKASDFREGQKYEQIGETSSNSIRDPEISDLDSRKIRKWVKLDKCVILQALPKDSLHHDCLSGVCELSSYENGGNWYGNSWSIHCHPDIASLSNRIALSSFWKINLNDQEILNIERSPGNREVLLAHVYYRVGRTLMKEKGERLPNLEKVKFGGEEWNKGIKYCKANMDKLAEDHALVILERKIKEQGLEDLMPDRNDIQILSKLYPKMKKIFKYQNMLLDENHFPRFGVKFSLLEYTNRDKILICWDIINQT
jgi:hypothetical protein